MQLDLLITHAAATWALFGLIWVIQLVQYPALALVGPMELGRYHAEHCRRITWIVAPLMGVELVTGVLLLAGSPSTLLWIGMGLIAANWACTAFVAMPLHGRLRPGHAAVQRALVRTNWIRTAAWSARGALVAVLLRQGLAA